jgi:MoaA/NifB/PqqE/SkfB family radical SAM enzyme
MDSKFETSLIKYLCTNFEADIHLEGGEVFLEETLLLALGILTETVRNHLTITTNGTVRIDDESVLKVLKSVGCMRVSVEGHTDELQKSVRGCELSPVLENALYYKAKGISVALRITANRLNYKHMFNKVIPSLQERGFDNFQIYEMQPVGRGESSGLCITEPLAVFYEEWLSHPVNANIKVSLPNKRKPEIVKYIPRFEAIGVSVYEVGDIASISIGVDGTVRICPWDIISEPLVKIAETNLATLTKIILMQAKPHVCEYCSRIVLKGGTK